MLGRRESLQRNEREEVNDVDQRHRWQMRGEPRPQIGRTMMQVFEGHQCYILCSWRSTYVVDERS